MHMLEGVQRKMRARVTDEVCMSVCVPEAECIPSVVVCPWGAEPCYYRK